MKNNPANPLIVQSDRTLLLDVHSPLADEARSALLPFAELEKSPEHLHTYRISSLSLWNAASAGLDSAAVLRVLEKYSRYPVPPRIMDEFSDTMSRYGKIRLTDALPKGPSKQIADASPETAAENAGLFLTSDDEAILAEIGAVKPLEKLIQKTRGGFLIRLVDRGSVKRELIKLGWPVKDEVPLVKGEPLEITLRKVSASGKPFVLRDYQCEAAAAVLGRGDPGSGYGVVVLPCGSGKTMVGILVMSLLKTNTLILTTNVAAVHQWINELLDKTELPKEAIAEYSGGLKSVAPVTIATYQILSWRPDKDALFPHFVLFHKRPWGLIIYDEVHLLPAPVFRVTAELQAVRRLGLTATLVREDHAEDAVFSLVGPKRYDVPWKDLEGKGWIASAICTEIRLDMPEELKIPYAVAPSREKYRMASENPYKAAIVRQLIANHPEDHILIIGQYLSQLEEIASLVRAPLVSGKTANSERERIYQAFRNGELRVIVVSKVANFAIDLPDASMAVQISGSFGSRQEEAQRLGRIIRPKKRNSYFYTLVSRYTVEESFAENRKKFLAEQGYTYSTQNWNLAGIPAPEDDDKKKAGKEKAGREHLS